MTCPTYKAAGSLHGHFRHGPGQHLDRFPVSPSPCLSRRSLTSRIFSPADKTVLPGKVYSMPLVICQVMSSWITSADWLNRFLGLIKQAQLLKTSRSTTNINGNLFFIIYPLLSKLRVVNNNEPTTSPYVTHLKNNSNVITFRLIAQIDS